MAKKIELPHVMDVLDGVPLSKAQRDEIEGYASERLGISPVFKFEDTPCGTVVKILPWVADNIASKNNISLESVDVVTDPGRKYWAQVTVVVKNITIRTSKTVSENLPHRANKLDHITVMETKAYRGAVLRATGNTWLKNLYPTDSPPSDPVLRMFDQIPKEDDGWWARFCDLVYDKTSIPFDIDNVKDAEVSKYSDPQIIRPIFQAYLKRLDPWAWADTVGIIRSLTEPPVPEPTKTRRAAKPKPAAKGA